MYAQTSDAREQSKNKHALLDFPVKYDEKINAALSHTYTEGSPTTAASLHGP